MYVPARLSYALRPGAPPGILVAAAAVAFMFGATPFLIPEVAAHFEVSLGVAGGISVAQVGAFATVNIVLPKLVQPSGRLLVVAGSGLVIANIVSAFAPGFAVLLALRAGAGTAAGTLTWIAWTDAMRQPRSLSSLASAGPVTALVGAPLLSLIAELGDRAVYLALAAAAIPIVFMKFNPGVATRTQAVSTSRSNRILLAALFLQVLAGSALFVFLAVAAREELGLSPVAGSLAFSLNALGGLIGARLSARHRRPGLWLATSGLAAFLTIGGGHPVWFFVGLFWWGLAFWMGIPGVLQMLADRSLEPGERAGDAQAVMAIGRTIGPIIGGGLTDAGAFTELAIIAGVGMATSGLTVVGVQQGRELLPPTDPV
jgi:DHA1 family inner membrane transport protein